MSGYSPPFRAVGCEIDACKREMFTDMYASQTHSPAEFYHLLKVAWKMVFAKKGLWHCIAVYVALDKNIYNKLF